MKKHWLVMFVLGAWGCDCGAKFHGVAPKIQVPPEIQFNKVGLGFSSTQKLTIRNVGTAPLAVDGLSTSAPFSVAGGPLEIGAGDNKDVEVTYTPTVEKLGNDHDSGVLAIASDDQDQPNVNVNLYGQGVKPAMLADPNPLDFGDVPVNGSKDIVLKITDVGSDAFHVTGIAFDKGGAVFGGALAGLQKNYLPGDTYQATVTYSPTAMQPDQGILTLTTDIPIQPTVSINLSGRGTKSVMAVCLMNATLRERCLPDMSTNPPATSAVLDFGAVDENGPAAQRTLTLFNDGNLDIPIGGTLQDTGIPFLPQPTCGTASDFTFSPNTLPALLTAGQSIPIVVSYKPTHTCPENLSDTGQITVRRTDNINPKSVTFSILGASNVPAIRGTQVSFNGYMGSTPWYLPYTVQNVGPGTLRITSVALYSSNQTTLCPAPKTPITSECDAFTWQTPPATLITVGGGSLSAPTTGTIGTLGFLGVKGNTYTAFVRMDSNDPIAPTVYLQVTGSQN